VKIFLRNIFFLLTAIGLLIAVGCAVDENGSGSSSSGTITLTGDSSSIGDVASSEEASSISSTPFGDTGGVSDPYLTAEVYDVTVTNGNATTDNFSETPITDVKLFSKTINVPIRAYTDGFPGIANKIEYFGIKYTGEIVAPESGTYTFLIVCDDGVSMSLGNTALSFTKITRGDAYWESAYNFCDDPAKAQGFREAGWPWLYDSKGTVTLDDDEGQYLQKSVGANINAQHPAGMYMATINLTAGEKYSFLLKYFQGPKVQIACTLKVVIPSTTTSELFNIDNFK